jgi:hypothetical protein
MLEGPWSPAGEFGGSFNFDARKRAPSQVFLIYNAELAFNPRSAEEVSIFE